MDKFNRIDILINNGGISQEGLALNTTTAVEQKIMDINYFGNVALSKAVLKLFSFPEIINPAATFKATD